MVTILRRIHQRTYYRLSHRWIQWNCIFNHQSRARFNMLQLRFKWICVVSFRCDFSSFAIQTSMEAHNESDFLWIPILSGNGFFRNHKMPSCMMSADYTQLSKYKYVVCRYRIWSCHYLLAIQRRSHTYPPLSHLYTYRHHRLQSGACIGLVTRISLGTT